MTPLGERDGMIVCFGKTMDELCAAVIAEIAHAHPQYHLQFVMNDWISADQLARAAVFWVVDATAEIADIAPVLQYDIPLLAPEASRALRESCTRSNGLFYQTKEEAMISLIRLVAPPGESGESGEPLR